MNLESLEHIKEVATDEYLNDTVEPLKEAEETYEQFERSFNPSELSEIVTDYETTNGIAERLATIPEVRYENWKNLSAEQRCEVLNRIEQYAAEIEHRPPLKVVLEPMNNDDLGYHSNKYGKIALNIDYVARDDMGMHREMINTIIHEGRHAYQHYNVDVKMVHESYSEVQTWAENFYNPKYQYYQSGSQFVPIRLPDGSFQNADYRLYYYQPVEIDARNFASDVIAKLEAQGVMSPKPNTV